MLRRSLRRLAGCFAIELACAFAALAADYEFQVGYATYGQAKSLAIEDRRGNRAIITTAAFSLPLSVAETIAAQVMADHRVERPGLLIYSVASGEPVPQHARTAIGAAIGNLNPGYLIFGNGRLTVFTYGGRCLIALTAEASLQDCTVPNGDSVHGTIRSAYQVVETTHGLQTRDAGIYSVAVQAIAIGNRLIIFSAPENFAQPNKRLILAVTPAISDDPRVADAVGQVFLRVGGRPQ